MCVSGPVHMHLCVSGPVHMHVCVSGPVHMHVCVSGPVQKRKEGGKQVLHVNTVDLLRKIMKVKNIIVFILKCCFVC